jgi:hypothetical protein
MPLRISIVSAVYDAVIGDGCLRVLLYFVFAAGLVYAIRCLTSGTRRTSSLRLAD